MTYTKLELIFLNELKAQAYGGTNFVQDINPVELTLSQKSGVISSLNKKDIIETEPEYGQISLVFDATDPFDGIMWEFDKDDVAELISRGQK